MIFIHPINAFMWTFRRNPRDVINLYNKLSFIMQLATGGNMLNFGYWSKTNDTPSKAQNKLCELVGNIAELDLAKNVADIGSGFSEPALLWRNSYPLEQIFSVNINYNQLDVSNTIIHSNSNLNYNTKKNINLINSTALKLPFHKESMDRIISLESAQHFRPLKNFVTESQYVLKKSGLFVMAIPILNVLLNSVTKFSTLGLLTFTWVSEHYYLNNVLSLVNKYFHVLDIFSIGQYVYVPLANYYIKNRDVFRDKISFTYNSLIEYVLFKSLLKMKRLSENKIIDYVIIKAIKEI
ncbi:MAG: methyltransferase domain-containing protein [Nitrososphaeraceae archaeon]